MRIMLIRHAESDANAGLCSSDPATIEITPKGREQAREVAEKFSTPPALIVTSSFIRTQQTAQPLIDKFPDCPVEVWPVQEFTYLSPAKCQNTTAEDRAPMVQEYWQKNDPDYCHGQGAETFREFVSRVCDVLGMLEQRNDGNIIIFCHMQFIAAILWLKNELSSNIDAEAVSSFRRFLEANKPANGQIVVI